MTKEYKQLARLVAKKGWTYQHTSQHIVFLGPNGKGRVTVAISASDRRAYQNTLSHFKKEGLDIRKLTK